MEIMTVPTKLVPLLEGVSNENKSLIKSTFLEYAAQIEEWRNKVQSIIVLDEDDTEEMAQAREARLFLQKVRTSADKKRQELKKESNAYNKAVQEFYNYIEGEVKPMEEHLLAQEKFVEIMQAEREKNLRAARLEHLGELARFIPSTIDLGKITEEEFNFYTNAAEISKKKEDDELAAQAKLKQEEDDRLQKLREENDRLKSAATQNVAQAFTVDGGTDEQILKQFKLKLKAIQLPLVKGKEAKAKLKALEEAINNL